MSAKGLTVALVAALIGSGGLAGTAGADFGIVPGSFRADATDNSGELLTQAGAHANGTTSFTINLTTNGRGETVPAGDLKDVEVDLPPGVIGDPTAAPPCQPADFAQIPVKCPAASQVGVVTNATTLFEGTGPSDVDSAVYNLAPAKGQVAQLGFQFDRDFVLITARVRTESDYGITATIHGIPGGVLAFGSKLTLWGVPADPAHDPNRFFVDAGTVVVGGKATTAPEPFFTNPTSCSGPAPTTRIRLRSWQNPNTWVSDEATAPIPTGCDKVGFDPSISVRPTLPVATQPSGYDVRLAFGQNDNPYAIANSPLRTAVVKLPAGVVTSPSSADGLEGCSVEQIGLKIAGEPTCPQGANIGTVSIKTPVLEEPLEGSVFLATPTPDQLIRLYIYAKGQGVVVKLAGKVDPDPVTGQLTATFEDNPQVPVSSIDLRFKGGPRSPLANPRSCGAATTTTSLTPWSGNAASAPSDAFIVSGDGKGSACAARRFAPKVVAGTQNPVGGKASPLSVTLGRDDADEFLGDLTMTLPQGLLARISSAEQCGAEQAKAGTCAVGSLIGSVRTQSGPGSLPLPIDGRVYLTGPYGDAPFGLSIVVPAKAGPFDLGDVVVRQKIYVDPITAQVTVVSDPLPTILKGIPLQIRLADVHIDRPDFTINPTSCAPKAISATVRSDAGTAAAVDSRFQVGSCGDLALKPSLALTLSGKGQTRDGGHPAVSAVVSQPPGQANLKKVRVALPLSLALDPDNSNSDAMCSFVEGSKPDPKCPASSVVGKATAVTPILNQPLNGPVYFVKNERKDPKSGRSIKTTPKLVVPLVGENGVKLTLTGASTVVDDQLVTTFDNIPDAPVSSFRMDIKGGKKGILVVSGDKADICKSTQIADQQIDGQNNKAADTDVFIQTPSCPLKVLSKKVGKTSVTVKVGGLGAGKITLTGKGIKKTSKKIAKSTVATITVKRTKGIAGKVTVSFDPAGSAKARKASG
jgi:hypothetical protein